MRFLLGLAVVFAVVAIPAPARAEGLGGFTLSAEAAPVAIQIFEPAIPIPAEPQLELNMSYSRAKLDSGPVGRGVVEVGRVDLRQRPPRRPGCGRTSGRATGQQHRQQRDPGEAHGSTVRPAGMRRRHLRRRTPPAPTAVRPASRCCR